MNLTARLPLRLWLTVCAAVCLATWWLFLRPVTPLDFDVFARAGHVVAHGDNPYPRSGTPFVWSGSAFVYPWVSAWCFAPLSGLSLHAGAIVMSVVSFAALALGVYVLVGTRVDAFCCVVLAAPTLDGLQMGTINAILFLGVCLAWRWRDAPALTGLAVGVLIALKVFCWPLVLWLALTRRWQAAAWAVGSALVLLGIGWIAGPIGPSDYVHLLSQLSSHEVHQAAGLQGPLVRAGLPTVLAEAVGVLLGVAAVVIGARRSDEFGYAGAVLGALLASPVVWHHYYLLCAAPLLLLPYGAVLYLLLGWMSVSARTSYGIAWWPLSVAATVVLAGWIGLLLWRRRPRVEPG